MNLHCHAMTEPGSTGGTLRAWFVPDPDGTDDSTGTLVGTFQSVGDAAQTDPFTLKWWDGSALVPLEVKNDVFGISYAFEAQARYNLEVMYVDEDEPSSWHSSDSGRTWERGGRRIYFVIDRDAIDGPMVIF